MEWLKDMAATYNRDSSIYLRRVLAEFSIVAEHPYFDEHSIDRCTDQGWAPGVPHICAVDWGKRVDYTAVVDLRGKKVMPHILVTQQDYMVTVDEIERRHKAEPFDSIISDLGAGEAQVEEMKRRRLPVIGFRFTSRSKLDIYSNLKLLLETGELDLPKEDELLFQLKSFEEIPRSDGSIRLSAPEGQHDDIADALAMAVMGLRKPRRMVRRPGFGGQRRREEMLDARPGRQVA
jgi:hypothetical protein